jgi:hypothetical protein
MRRAILVMVGMLTLAAWPTDLVAQQRGAGPMAAPTDSLVDAYNSRLNLTAEQSTDLKAILEAQYEKAQEMFEAVSGQGREAMMEMRPKMEQLQKETSERVEELLTEDQIPEYRKIQEEIREQRRTRMRQRQPGG